MSKNPVEEYLSEKAAGAIGDFAGGLRYSAGRAANPTILGMRVARGAAAAGGAALGAGAIAGAVFGAQKLYDVVTKARDFRKMLEWDPHIAQQHQEDPRKVNQMFSTLRAMNPGFTKDPVVASNYVGRMLEGESGAGVIAVEALGHRDRTKNPLVERVTQSAFQGPGKK